MKFKIFFFLVFYNLCFAQSEHIVLRPRLQLLLDDMKLYKLDSEGELYLHAGDLYEHSMWTYNGMWELLHGNSLYVGNMYLTERQQEVVALAALLHDIGKAGRLELFDECHAKGHYNIVKNDEGVVTEIVYYQDYQAHPCIGFEYVGRNFFEQPEEQYLFRNYWVIERETGTISEFGITHMFDELGLTQEEQKLVAILIGMHYEFGNLKHNKITIEGFLMMLENFVKAVNYNDGTIDELIVYLAMLIQIADVKGLIPVKAQPSPLFSEGIECEPVHFDLKFENPFASLGYECEDDTVPFAVLAMNKVLNYFHEMQQETPEVLTLLPSLTWLQ